MSFVKPSARSGAVGSFVNPGSFAIGSLNHLSGSSSNKRTQEPHKIDFSQGWRIGPTEDWYQDQLKSGRSTKFKYLQYRKEREQPFYHEFIVVELDNDTVCRFDRRGAIDSRANVLIGEPIPSEDTAHVIDKKSGEKAYTDIENTSDLLLRMHFPKGQDLLTILAICYGIQKNKATQSYSLTRYNCYFYSWMIITATARFTVDWASLAKEGNLWEALLASVMNGLSRDQVESGPLANPKATVAATLGIKSKTDSLAPVQFVGSAYLCNALQNALVETREQIRQSLAELILHTTVDKAMHDVSETSAQKAGSRAARSHAAQAARDAAMEAVIETMWRDIISSNEGGNLWESKCDLANKCVDTASAAAADAAGQVHRIIITPPATPAPATPAPVSASTPTTPAVEGAEIPAPPAKWETAWDAAWEESWAAANGRPRSNTNGSGGDADPSKSSISDRAKAAWIKAWEEACKANEQYVPLISRGVADYVTKNLPEALPEVLQYETDTNAIKNMVKALVLPKGSSNSKLQDWVKARILEHCQRVVRMTAGAQQPNKAEFEDTMKGVWESTVRCLLDKQESEALIKE